MCQWFSSVTLGDGKLFYFSPEERQTIYDGGHLACKIGINSISTRDELDSHSAICSYYGFNCDRVNKYEFRPLDRKFTVDQINVGDDSKKVKNKLCHLNYKKLAPPELIFKPIIDPTTLKKAKVTESDIKLLKQWDSVWDSVGDSVRASVWDSVRASVGDSVMVYSVGASVWDSVRASVGDSVMVYSVGASVKDSVLDSVLDSVWAYIGSFFTINDWKHIKHEDGEYPYQCVADLWERGLAPSFDGKTWRLHGYKGKVLKEITRENLIKE